MQLLASILYSKTTGATEGIYGSTNTSIGTFNTSFYYFNALGRLWQDRPLSIKLRRTYQLPYGINLSGHFLHSLGNPFARPVSVWAPIYKGYVTINGEPRGSKRNPSFNNLDLKVEKGFAF